MSNMVKEFKKLNGNNNKNVLAYDKSSLFLLRLDIIFLRNSGKLKAVRKLLEFFTFSC